MRIKTGYYYKCSKCGIRLDDNVNFLLYQLNPIKFDYLIKECPKCGNKYKVDYNLEFFYATNKLCNKLLISSLLTWILWIDLIIVGIIVFVFENFNNELFFIPLLLFDIIFGIFYFFNFKRRWRKAIIQSIKRFNDADYIFDLLLFGLLDIETINECYNKGIVSSEIYSAVME